MEHFLAPVLALICWSLIIWILMYVRRLPAMTKANIAPDDAKHPGSLDTLPSTTRAVADNYNHLMEQPTIFYALMFYLQLTTGGDDLSLKLAWAYVVLRVLHSLVQVTVNKVMIRFGLFTVSTIILIFMAARALAGAL
ncbi:MAG: MAPEG family protein [Maricaulaceae bacterium]